MTPSFCLPRAARLTVWLTVMSAVLACLPPATPALAQSDPLEKYSTRFYTIYTDLEREDAAPFGAHMDAVFAEYQRRFSSFHNSAPGPMSLYLFRTQEEYQHFLKRHDINATNTGGMFFVQSGLQGLATWVQGKSVSATFAVLQHEGFHQFAFHYIGPDLPNWVNEGIAQYFEDAVMVGDTMYCGLANARRVESVKAALSAHRAIDFDHLLAMQPEEWHAQIIRGGDPAVVLYDQSWSMVYFLIHASDGKYTGAFENYLTLVSKKHDSAAAFREAFGAPDTSGFRTRWEEFVRNLRPDPVNVALERMEFLGQALLFMKGHGIAMPQNIEALRSRLRAMRFEATRRDPLGMVTHISGTDESLYHYTRSDGVEASFKLLPPEDRNLLPRISALGLKPEPTVVWWRDSQEHLMQDVVFQ